VNIISVTDQGMGTYRIEGDGFMALATIHRSWAKEKKTRVYKTEAMQEAAQADLLEKKGMAEPVYPTRPEGVINRWDLSETGRSYAAALETVEEAFSRYYSAVRRLVKPRVIAALADLGLPVESLSYNRKAGCSCGCSPAYVAPTTLTLTAMVFPKYGEPGEREFAIESLFLK
jgi:hypothetical protein